MIIPQGMRQELRRPLGRLMQMDGFISAYGKGKIISVGDVVTFSLLKAGIRPFISVYDFRSMRREVEGMVRAEIRKAYPDFSTAQNPAGSISAELERACARLAKAGGALYVEGEEDLAALVLMRICGDGVIAYGQPEEGVVAVECGAKSMEKAEQIFRKIREWKKE